MQFRQEIANAALDTIRKTIIGKDIKHKEGTFRIAEIHPDSYNMMPCLVARCFPLNDPEDEGIQLVIRVGMLDG